MSGAGAVRLGGVSSAGSSSSSTPRIVLVADDEPMVLTILSRELLEAGYRVITAGDGWEAWRQAQNQPFDLLITDHVMPMMSGAQLVKKVRAERPAVPVIMISGNFADPDTPTGYPPDVVMMYKPFTGEKMIAEVRRLLA
jgi:DNA-binding response OmpR family regulator